MKIGFFELEGWEEQMLRERFGGHDLRFSNDKISAKDAPSVVDFDVISVFVNSVINAETLAYFPNLKYLSTRSTGYDHIDLPACSARGVRVGFVPGYGDNTVAEFAFGLILNLTRKQYRAIDQIKETDSFSLVGLRGIDLKGKTLGVLGTGRIGKEAIRIGNGFGMHVIAYDPFPNEEAAKTFNFSYASLEGVLGNADVITIHCPLTEQTRHLINRDTVKLIKRGAYLVNTARGGIVETAALVDALMDGTLAGAGLDVLEEEGDVRDEMKLVGSKEMREEKLRVMLQNHSLMHMTNALITPHNAFNTQEAMERILNTTMENVASFIAGTPKNLVS